MGYTINTKTIILKKSGVAGKVPTPTDLQEGELAINYRDGRVFLKKVNDNNDAEIIDISYGPDATAASILQRLDVIEITYDQEDRIDTIRYTGDGGSNPPYFRDVFTYDSGTGLLARIDHYLNETDLTSRTGHTDFTYNSDGLLISAIYARG